MEQKGDTGEMSKGVQVALEKVGMVHSEVNKLEQQLSELNLSMAKGEQAEGKKYEMMGEMLMVQLLKLDGIEVEGEARAQRKAEVKRVQGLVDNVDRMKLSAAAAAGAPVQQQPLQAQAAALPPHGAAATATTNAAAAASSWVSFNGNGRTSPLQNQYPQAQAMMMQPQQHPPPPVTAPWLAQGSGTLPHIQAQQPPPWLAPDGTMPPPLQQQQQQQQPWFPNGGGMFQPQPWLAPSGAGGGGPPLPLPFGASMNGHGPLGPMGGQEGGGLVYPSGAQQMTTANGAPMQPQFVPPSSSFPPQRSMAPGGFPAADAFSSQQQPQPQQQPALVPPMRQASYSGANGSRGRATGAAATPSSATSSSSGNLEDDDFDPRGSSNNIHNSSNNNNNNTNNQGGRSSSNSRSRRMSPERPAGSRSQSLSRPSSRSQSLAPTYDRARTRDPSPRRDNAYATGASPSRRPSMSSSDSGRGGGGGGGGGGQPRQSYRGSGYLEDDGGRRERDRDRPPSRPSSRNSDEGGRPSSSSWRQNPESREDRGGDDHDGGERRGSHTAWNFSQRDYSQRRDVTPQRDQRRSRTPPPRDYSVQQPTSSSSLQRERGGSSSSLRDFPISGPSQRRGGGGDGDYPPAPQSQQASSRSSSSRKSPLPRGSSDRAYYTDSQGGRVISEREVIRLGPEERVEYRMGGGGGREEHRGGLEHRSAREDREREAQRRIRREERDGHRYQQQPDDRRNRGDGGGSVQRSGSNPSLGGPLPPPGGYGRRPVEAERASSFERDRDRYYEQERPSGRNSSSGLGQGPASPQLMPVESAGIEPAWETFDMGEPYPAPLPNTGAMEKNWTKF